MVNCRSDVTRTNETSAVWTTDAQEVNGLAFDWMHNNLYWADSSRNVIAVLSLSNTGGKWHRTLIEENLDRPKAVALDPRDDNRLVLVREFSR
jgi:sugar lactone lactonase YvrE